jgi:hypothetical protein
MRDMSQTDKEREVHEHGWTEGYKAAARSMMQHAMTHLDDAERTEAAWRLERADTVAVLRQICAEYGDNDWPDSLHLRDVIEKHLYRHLDD